MKYSATANYSHSVILLCEVFSQVQIILGAKLCLMSVKKRLNHRDPHVVLLALSLLDSLWSNCGTGFRREVSSREFLQELSFKATHVSFKISVCLRVVFYFTSATRVFHFT